MERESFGTDTCGFTALIDKFVSELKRQEDSVSVSSSSATSSEEGKYDIGGAIVSVASSG